MKSKQPLLRVIGSLTAASLLALFLFSSTKTIKAPDFPGSCPWLNTHEHLSLEKLKGHVILLNFWTYGSINCIHVIPDLEYLEKKYHDKPFHVIGVHSAKFYNEQDAENIRAAIARYEIKHPVIVDKGHKIWRTYRASAWPTFVLIGSDGNVIVVLRGEGQRNTLDRLIQGALKLGKRNITLAAQKYEIKIPPIPERQLAFPGKLAMNIEKQVLYISDSNHNQIVEAVLETPTKANVRHRIGSGRKGLKDGNYTKSAFFRPQGIDFHNGRLYVADTENHAIRVVDLTKKKVKTLIGTGKQGDYGEPNSPWDLVYYNNNLYIAMAGSHQLWRYDLKKKKMDHAAGNGYQNIMDGSAFGSSLAQPSGITTDGKNLYFADSEASALRYSSIEKGAVKTLIGKGLFKFGFRDGKFADAYLQHPLGVFYSDNKVYIADTYNHAVRTADLAAGTIRTLIKRSNKTTCNINGTDYSVLPLYEPNDVLVYKNYIYIADTNNHLIRVYDTTTKKLETLILVE
ncbi:MAG: redoxin family protein [Candidatus Aminicenantes bacterium]|nr:redoxin family protein [Candidatus Aminicenantes bacterium]NIM80637.1 redoxin family protein [Candidatus Aminicenantes bacterium]NIN20018.1 redoxin family protein [Candidatus Aminicenantes bacterium]NIN47996.1 redoxin family protein [Candidatus Aminicenantes bacterium]NIN89342.1 redoxin family protein [Candidatus Aminicenantes bacterium]